jgi:hypothetical protein
MALITFTSCSSKPDAPIPADASFVMHIDGASISDKLPWSEIKESQLFKTVLEETDGDPLAKTILNDPAQSGIDVKSNGWAFVSLRGKGAYSAFIWGLKDAATFEGFLKKANPDIKINKKESTSYLAEGTTLVAWKDKSLMVLADASELTEELNDAQDDFSSEDMGSEEGEPQQSFELSSDSLLNIAFELQSLKSEAKLTSDDKFADLISTDGDVHFWFNAGKMYNNTMAGSLLALSKVGSLLEGNIGAITVNFTNGGIDIHSKGYMGKDLQALYEKYEASNFDESALKNLPAGEVNMALAMNYPPEGLKGLLSLFGVDGLVNTFMQEAGFSIDEFIKANSGNLFFALSDFKINQVEKSFEGFDGEPMTYTSEEPDGKLLFGAEVKDRNAFQKMMDVAKQYLTEKLNMPETELEKIPYELKDKWFVSGNNPDQIKQFGSAKTEHAFIDRIKGHPIGLFVNISSFIKGAMAQMSEDKKFEKELATLSMGLWKDLVMTGGELKNGATVTDVRIALGDANTNSLKSLNQYLGQIAKLAKEDEKRRAEEWGGMEETEISPDSTLTVPAQ